MAGLARSRFRGIACGIAALIGVMVLTSCGRDDQNFYKEASVEVLYNSGMDSLSAGSYKQAAKDFEELDRQHPYSVWATKAQLMAAFSYYQANKYDDAIIALDRFIQLHPGHRDIAYAYYLRALCYYEQIQDVGRDQRITEQALQSLADVASRFPDSPYARDSRLKVDLAVDHLGGKEMEIGRYYQRQYQYIAAINRYRTVIDRFQTTTHVAEALHRLVECYLALGVQDEAQMAAAVLGHNYPGSDWYAESYYLLKGEDLRPARKQGSWLERFFR